MTIRTGKRYPVQPLRTMSAVFIKKDFIDSIIIQTLRHRDTKKNKVTFSLCLNAFVAISRMEIL